MYLRCKRMYVHVLNLNLDLDGAKAREPLRTGAGDGSVDLVDHARKAKIHTEDPPYAAG